jgi:hypothetical protein
LFGSDCAENAAFADCVGKRCQPPNLGNLADCPDLVAGTFSARLTGRTIVIPSIRFVNAAWRRHSFCLSKDGVFVAAMAAS